MGGHCCWGKVKVVRCGLEDADFANPGDGIQEATRLVCVGRLSAQKGQLLLIEAAKILAEEGCDFQLVLAGDGEMRRVLEAAISSAKMVHRIRITGWISGAEVRREIRAARALVLPSFAEGLPIVLMEAMALRRPVISTFVSGIPELVANGKHGWLVPAGDAAALANAMRACINASDEIISEMGVRLTGSDRQLQSGR